MLAKPVFRLVFTIWLCPAKAAIESTFPTKTPECEAFEHFIRETIEVRVLPDKIEILSHPGADRSISIEGLKNYRAVSRRYRNRRIGEFLKELHLTEGRNTGFQKIIRALKANGSPMPVFETDEERTYFLTTISIHPDFFGVT